MIPRLRSERFTASRTLEFLLGAAACFTVIVQPAWPSANDGDAAGTPRTTTRGAETVHSCPWKDLKFSASTKASNFGTGQPILLTSTVANHNSVTCSITIGHDHGYDPSQVIVNQATKFVWDACDLNNKAGSCSNLWMLEDLAPGASYVLDTTWSQRWGQGSGNPPTQVPAGHYVFASGYSDLINSVVHNASATVGFAIR